jgi:hypothetical protein
VLPDVTVFIKLCDGHEIAGVTNLDAVTYDPRTCTGLTLLPAVAGLFQTPNPTAHIIGPDLGSRGSPILKGKYIF